MEAKVLDAIIERWEELVRDLADDVGRNAFISLSVGSVVADVDALLAELNRLGADRNRLEKLVSPAARACLAEISARWTEFKKFNGKAIKENAERKMASGDVTAEVLYLARAARAMQAGKAVPEPAGVERAA